MPEQEVGTGTGWAAKVVSGLSHPLLLLIIGSLLGSFLIPYVSSLTGRKQLLQEARLKKALEILHNNSQVNSQLNVLRSRLGIFHQDNIRLKPSPAELKQRQDRLAEDVNARYLEFDKVAWWWHKDLYQEAIILEIAPPDGSRKLGDDLAAYGDNVTKSVGALGEFWHACISKDYEFEDGGRVTQIQKEMDRRMGELYAAREKLVSDVVRDFTAPRQ